MEGSSDEASSSRVTWQEQEERSRLLQKQTQARIKAEKEKVKEKREQELCLAVVTGIVSECFSRSYIELNIRLHKMYNL